MKEISRDYLSPEDVEFIKGTANVVAKEGLEVLVGKTGVDVDTLQLVLETMEYKKGTIGKGTLWYRNIISNASGYVAELEAVNPEGKIVTFVVQCVDDITMPVGFCYKEEH